MLRPRWLHSSCNALGAGAPVLIGSGGLDEVEDGRTEGGVIVAVCLAAGRDNNSASCGPNEEGFNGSGASSDSGGSTSPIVMLPSGTWKFAVKTAGDCSVGGTVAARQRAAQHRWGTRAP